MFRKRVYRSQSLGQLVSLALVCLLTIVQVFLRSLNETCLDVILNDLFVM